MMRSFIDFAAARFAGPRAAQDLDQVESPVLNIVVPAFAGTTMNKEDLPKRTLLTGPERAYRAARV